MGWVDANTHSFKSLINEPPEEDDCWCEDCEEHCELLTLKELWERFADVEVNAEDEIEEDFICFPVGTSKFDVWHWFDDRCPNGLVVDLMGETNKYSKQ